MQVRLSDGEKGEIEAAAGRAEMVAAKWVRQVLLSAARGEVMGSAAPTRPMSQGEEVEALVVASVPVRELIPSRAGKCRHGGTRKSQTAGCTEKGCGEA